MIRNKPLRIKANATASVLLGFWLVAAGAYAMAEERAACACKRTPRVWKDFKQARAVFVGVVESESDDHIRLRVGEAWKGVSMGNRYVKLVRRSSKDCGFVFEPRVHYMVYAYALQGAEPKTLWASICSRTRPSADANRDREIIGQPKWIRW